MVSTVDVSVKWQAKFALLEKIGAAQGLKNYFANYKQLTATERMAIGFNLWAFFFGPFYYFAKKMYLKGVVFLGAIIFVNSIVVALDPGEPILLLFQFVGPAACASFANYDYYRFYCHKEVMWEGLHFLKENNGSFIFFAGAFLASLSVFWFGSGTGVPNCSDPETTDLVIEIADREMGNQLGPGMAKNFSYSVDAIRTTAVNEQTGSYQCAAQLGITAANTGDTNELSITYTVELTDDGEEFYVNVFGL